MSGRIRVLVVDDSAVVRHLVSEMISGDPDLEVVGTASNGRIALEKIRQLAPDVVTLDVDMPVLDGLETLRTLRAENPVLPVLMLSSLTRQGASLTLDCLYHGATDYVAKPSAADVDALARLRAELLPRIKHFGRRARPLSSSAWRGRIPSPDAPRGPALPYAVRAVVVAASTGGPNALAELFGAMPRAPRVPVLVVQHMPPLFTRALAERLDGRGGLHVREAVDGHVAGPGEAWIAPGDFHLEVKSGDGDVRLRTHQGAPENSCRPSADVLFRSAAALWGTGVLAVVMTGMGQDGLRGARAVREAGGRVLVQDPKSSTVWGMPGAVVEAGLAENMLPPAALGAEIHRRCDAGGLA
jgi:two-component system chemotaxis response regulator CheB